MLIILEGPDGSGKSTLAAELTLRLAVETSQDNVVHDITLAHAGPPQRHPLNEYLRPLVSYRPGTQHHMILDRWHWGEHVYPRVLTRDTQLDDASWWTIEAYLRRLGAVVINCDRMTRMSYVQTYRDRGIDASAPDAWQYRYLDKIRLEFTRASYRSHLPSLDYRFDDDVPLPIDQIIKVASEYENRLTKLNSFQTYLGPARPEILLIGDVRKILGEDAQLPAFVPYPATSGHFLLSALTRLNNRSWLRGFGLANACDVDDTYALWEILGQPKIVALGQNAHKRLTAQLVPHGTVPHPQFIRRFHHSQDVEYAWLIYRTALNGEDNSKWPS